MIVVHFKEHKDSHDCWGKYEVYTTERVVEFESVDSWLKYRQKKDVSLIALYEVSKKITD